jgi:glutathione S-transferase
VNPEQPIYHFALGADWSQAMTSGREYRRSTIGRSLEEEGFIHCSFAHQVKTVADLFYRDRHDVVLLTIDPRRVDSLVVVETPDGGDEGYPHVYGPLPLEAVVRVTRWESPAEPPLP